MLKLIPASVLLIALIAAPVQVDGSGARIVEIPIADLVSLGDNQPNWNTTIQIRKGELRRSTYAAIEFVGVGVWEGTSSNIIINGRKYVLPISEPTGIGDLALRGKSVIAIPIGILRKGNNTIVIEAGPINNPTNLYDDFDLANVVLVLSR